jgi:hypothetical protein
MWVLPKVMWNTSTEPCKAGHNTHNVVLGVTGHSIRSKICSPLASVPSTDQLRGSPRISFDLPQNSDSASPIALDP